MPARFRPGRHGPTARLAPGESALLGALLGELMTLLSDEDGASAQRDPLEALTGMSPDGPTGERPDDAVLARLFPDAYTDDAARAVEFRRFTQDELRAAKRAAAQRVLASLPANGGRVVLDDELTEAWMGALNDLRLALGTRLEVTEDSYAELQGMDPSARRAQELSVYMWLGWLQETLVDTQL